MTRQQLLEQINTLLADNDTQDITPERLRTLFSQFSASFFNNEDDQMQGGGGGGINPSDYYTKIELQTDLQAQVHWDNITNVPALGDTTSTNTEVLSSNKTLQTTAATYQFLNPNGTNRTITLDTMTTTKAFVIKNIGTSFYLQVQTGAETYSVGVDGILALIWDGTTWQEI